MPKQIIFTCNKSSQKLRSELFYPIPHRRSTCYNERPFFSPSLMSSTTTLPPKLRRGWGRQEVSRVAGARWELTHVGQQIQKSSTPIPTHTCTYTCTRPHTCTCTCTCTQTHTCIHTRIRIQTSTPDILSTASLFTAGSAGKEALLGQI